MPSRADLIRSVNKMWDESKMAYIAHAWVSAPLKIKAASQPLRCKNQEYQGQNPIQLLSCKVMALSRLNCEIPSIRVLCLWTHERSFWICGVSSFNHLFLHSSNYHLLFHSSMYLSKQSFTSVGFFFFTVHTSTGKIQFFYVKILYTGRRKRHEPLLPPLHPKKKCLIIV